MKYLILIIMLVLSVNCVSAAGYPVQINGSYFTVGDDDNCEYYKVISVNIIDCYDRHEQYTGQRNAMSAQASSEYQSQVNQEAQRRTIEVYQQEMEANRAEMRRQGQLNRQAQQRAREEESYDRALDSFKSSQRSHGSGYIFTPDKPIYYSY